MRLNPYVKSLTYVFLFLILSSNSKGQSCETGRAAAIQNAADGCASPGNNYCTPSEPNQYSRFCIYTSGISLRRFSESGGLGHRMICPYSWTYDTFYPNEPSTHDSGSAEFDFGGIWDCTNVEPQTGTNSPPNSCQKSGSIVHIDTQSLSENVPLVGTSFSLVYTSKLQDGRSADYNFKIPISGNTPRDAILSFVVETRRDGVLVDSASFQNSSPNQSYEYTWNGLNSTNTAELKSQKFDITFKETYSSGTYPSLYSVILGHFKAKSIQVGGWLPSILRNYDVNAKRLYDAYGNMKEVEAKPFAATNLKYIAEENFVYLFDSNGRHVSTKTSLTGSTIYTFNYDSQGRLTSIGEPFGRTTTFNRSTSGNLQSVSAPKGQLTSITLDSNNFISSITNPNNETYSFTYYGSNGLMHAFTKPQGQVSTFEFDSKGLLTKDSHSSGYFFELVKSINEQYNINIAVTSSMGRQTSVHTSTGENRYLNRYVTYPSGETESYQFNSQFSASYENSTAKGVNSNTTYQNDDRFGSMRPFIQSASYSSGSTYRYVNNTQNVTLSDANDPFSISSATWTTQSTYPASIATTYDPSNKKFISTSYLNRTIETQIDDYERVISTKQGSLNSINFNYTNENLSSITHGTRTTQLTYNATTGFLESITNPLSQVTSFVFNSAGRMTSQILPDSRVIGYSYDANGNVISVTPPGRPAHVFNINNNELIGSYAPPTLSGISVVNTTYSYNLDKQLTSITRPDGTTIDFNYNATTGVLENYVTPDGAYSLTMDLSNGLPAQITKPDGSYTSIYYAGTMITQTSSYDSSYNYLGSYHPTFSNTPLPQSDTVEDSVWTFSTINYGYDDDGNLTSAGDLVLSYNSPNNQLTDTSLGAGSTGLTDTYTYNNYGEITGYQAKYGTNVIYDLTLSRDGMGRVNGKTQILNGSTDTYGYTFDSSGRLTQTTKNSVTSATLAYDSNSNRNGGVIGAQTTTASYDNQDRLSTYNTLSFTYNANGDLTGKANNTLNQTTQYVYDVFGNLKQITLPNSDVITYEIDGLNRRIGKLVNGSLQKRWIYKDQYRIAAELDSTGAITKRFVYGSKSNIPDYFIENNENYRIISDHLGSLRLVVKQSDGSIIQRMDHDEFGRVVVDTNPGYLPFGFAGGLYDNQTGLVRFGARDYDPEVGRWTSKDPILFNGGDTNLFGYVQNDPVNFIDPEGKFPWAIAAAFLGSYFWSSETDTPGASTSELWQVPAAGLAAGGACSMAVTGSEIALGGARVAPFGNRTGHPTGRYPHYHRNIPDPMNPGQSIPGQGIGRHRPWDVKSPDKSFWDRF